MPYCLIEYSQAITKQVAPQVLVESVHQAIVDSGLFDVNRYIIRTCAKAYEHYQVGDDRHAQQCFIHMTLHLLPEYSEQQKGDLAADLIEVLQVLPIKKVVVSCEIAELDGQTYSRLYVD